MTIYIYKSEFGTSSALYVHRFQVKRVIKINDNASVFTAELYAIVTALCWISQNRYAKNLIISDSLSSLKAISCHENDCRHFLVDKIKLLPYFLDSIDVNVTYLWVPSHNGIQDNKIADDLAKNAARRNCDPGISTVNLDLSLSEIKSIIKRHCLKIWQQQYISNSTGVFYKKCFPSIYNRNLSSCPQIFRLQTGHCRLNSHMQRIGLYDTGLCSRCNVPEDVIQVQSPKINFDKRIKEVKCQIHTPNFVRSKSDFKSFHFSQNIWCSYLMRQLCFSLFFLHWQNFNA